MEHKLSMINIPNYIVGSCFMRKANIHGGSCLLVREDILFDELVDLKNKSKELIIECSAVKLKKLNIIVINIYRSPAGDIKEFMVILDEILDETFKKYTQYKITLCGDFNIDLLNKTDERVKNFICLLKSYNFLQTIKEPTRVTDRSSTLIDNIFVNFEEYQSRVITTALSDHHGQEVEFGTQDNAIRKTNKRQVQKLTEPTLHNIQISMQNICWPNIMDTVDPVLNLERLLYTVKMAILEHSPVRIAPLKEQKPWIDDDIRTQSRRKRNYMKVQ